MRSYKLIFLTIILLVFSSNALAATDSAYDLNLDVKEFQLENGMQFLVVERPATPQVAVRLAIRAGSALEASGKTGIAHLLEHMMFKGTKNFGSLDYQKDEQLQARIEAAYQAVLEEQKKRNPDPAFIEKKRAEMNDLRLEVQNIYEPQVFSSQLGKNGAVGVNAFTSKDQTQYLASVPSDMLEQWFSIASEQLFEPAWREFYVEKEVIQREWAFRYINDPNGAAWLDLNTEAYTAHPYRNPTIGWKSDMEKYSTQDAIEFHKTFYNPSNAVCVLVGDITLENARRLAQTYFKRYAAGERAPEKVTREPVQQGPRQSIRYLKNYLEKLDAVTPEDIRRAANKYLQTDNKTSVYVIPGGRPDRPPESYSEVRSITGSSAAQGMRAHDLKNISRYPTPVDWKHSLSFQRHPAKIEYPAAQRLDIAESNVFCLPDRELPVVNLTLFVKVGSVDVADSKIGLTDLLNDSIIRGGTENYPPAELARVLDENAIRISVGVGEEDTVIQLSVLKEDWQAGLSLLQEILTRPGFDPAVLEIVKTQALTGLKRQGGDAQAVAGREREIWQFKGHPYGRDPLAGLQTIPAISGEDLKQFLWEHIVPSGIVAAVAGDIDQAEVIAGLEQFYKALPQTCAPLRKMADPAATAPVLALIHKPGQVQSQIALTLPSVKRTHPDYWKINLLMSVFGGSDSLMYTRLRDDLGLV